MGYISSGIFSALDSKEMNMQIMKKKVGELTKKVIRTIAMTTVSSTTRYLAYQPEKDGKLADKYLK